MCGRYASSRRPEDLVEEFEIDKVEVKPLADCSPREIEKDNPEIKRTDDMANFLGQLYSREVTEESTVTIIHFSEINS